MGNIRTHEYDESASDQYLLTRQGEGCKEVKMLKGRVKLV